MEDAGATGGSQKRKPSILDEGTGTTITGSEKNASKPALAFEGAKIGADAKPADNVAPGTGDAAGTGDAPYGYFPDGRPRKRKPRAGTAPKSTRGKKEDLAGIEALLLSLHTMAAAGFKAPEWSIGENEAKELARALKTVQDEYDFELDPKLQAWLNLGAIAGMMYGPRIAVSMARVKKAQNETPKQDEKPSDNVTPLPSQKSSAKKPMTPTDIYGPGNSGG